MSYSEMQRYINELFEENKTLKIELNQLKNKIPRSYIKEYTLNLMTTDNEFLYQILDHAITISKQAIADVYYYQNKDYP